MVWTLPKSTATCRISRWSRARSTRPINWRWGLAALLALWLFAAAAARPAAAGQIVDARTAGPAGPQLDAAQLSPQPRRLPAPAGGWRTYQVQPGDTLAAIAARVGSDPAALAARNGLSSPDRILAGQMLRIDAGPAARPVLPAGAPLVRVQFWPWPPAQGQTLAVWLHAAGPVSFTLTYDGRPYAVHSGGQRGWALIPIPPLTPPGPKPLVVTAGDQVWPAVVEVQAGSFSTDNIPASTTQPILSDANKVQAEAAALAALFEAVTPGAWDGRSRFALPLDGDFPRTSPYGSRRTYGDNPAITAHAGEDFSAAPGTPVYAPAPGRVALAEALFVRGNAVVLDHGNGVLTGYWHLSALDVAAGEEVAQGQVLGKVGSTGLSTGAHLHWELRIVGMAVDPMQWLAP